jgi:hypothetical protein
MGGDRAPDLLALVAQVVGPLLEWLEAGGVALDRSEGVVAGQLVAPEAARTVGEALGGVSETGASLLTAEVCAIRLEEFARSGLVVEVWSAVLEEAVVFASDDARVDPGELRTVYRAHELRVLLGLSTLRELRRAHEVKRLFRGAITDGSPAGVRPAP